MPNNVRYRIAYARKSDGITTIDIHEKDYAGAIITTLQAAGNPLEIAWEGDPSNIYKPTIGSGATIRILATPLSLLGDMNSDSGYVAGLFTDDPQKYVVKIYNGISGSILRWQGFINTEIYSESYCNPINSEITIYCNDGMKVLENILYTDTDADTDSSGTTSGYYNGNETVAKIFDNILPKLGITFTTIYTANDIEISDTGDTNPFLYLKIPNENFIDESNVAMSCRQVLEGLIGGLGLVMYFEADNIYIIDPINLHDKEKGKSYDVATYNNEVHVDVGGYLDISHNEITWGKTGMSLDVVPALNEAVVKYDPYNFNEYSYDFSDSANWSTVGTFADQTGWYLNTGIEYTNWFMNHTDRSIGLKETLTSDPTYCLCLNDQDGEQQHVIPFSNVTQDAAVEIKISMSLYAHTRTNTTNIYSSAAATEINLYRIQFAIMVGMYYWKDDRWEKGQTGNYKQLLNVRQEGVSDAEYVADPSNSKVNDTWVTASVRIPLAQIGDIVEGDITVFIYDHWENTMVFPAGTWGDLHRIMIKDFKLEIVNASSGLNVGNDGVNTKAKISTNLIGKSIFEIETICGTGSYGCSRGAFKTDQQTVPGINITGLYRGADPTIYSTSKLILQSFVSQYKHPRFKLSGVLEVSTQPLNIRTKLIQDTHRLDTRGFYMINGTYNDREETIDCEMIEVEDIREVIV